MTDEIREMVLKDFEDRRERFEDVVSRCRPISDTVAPECERVEIPFMDSAGVICGAIYNFNKGRFTHIRVPFAKTGLMVCEWDHPTTARCDESEDQFIEISEGICER